MSAFYTAIVEGGDNINQMFALDKRFSINAGGHLARAVTPAIRSLFAKKKVQ